MYKESYQSATFWLKWTIISHSLCNGTSLVKLKRRNHYYQLVNSSKNIHSKMYLILDYSRIKCFTKKSKGRQLCIKMIMTLWSQIKDYQAKDHTRTSNISKYNNYKMTKSKICLIYSGREI